MVKDKVIEKVIFDANDPDFSGRLFFSKQQDIEATKNFLTAFLITGQLEELAKAMRYGFAKLDAISGSFINKSLELDDLDGGYFNLFIELCNKAKIQEEQVILVCVASYYALEDGLLCKWKRAAKKYLTNLAFSSFDFLVNILFLCDKEFLSFEALLDIDSEKTSEVLLDSLLYKKNINKAALRKFLLSHKIDISHLFGSEYFSKDVKTREAIVRLALLFKNEVETAMFLERALKFDNSQFIRFLISAADDRREKRRRPLSVIEEFNRKLKTGERFSALEFTKRLKIEPAFETLASQLFFGVYQQGRLIDIALVHEGTVYDTDNILYPIKDNLEFSILHPIDIPENYSYIRDLTITGQPIEQIGRACYFPAEHEQVSNEVCRVSGVLLSTRQLRANILDNGFKLISTRQDNKYTYAALFLKEFAIVIGFTPTNFLGTNEIVTLEEARFYKAKSFIPIRGKLYLEGVPNIQVSEVPKRIFSECVRALKLLTASI